MADFDFSPRGLLYFVVRRYFALVIGLRFILAGLVFDEFGDFVTLLLGRVAVARLITAELHRQGKLD